MITTDTYCVGNYHVISVENCDILIIRFWIISFNYEYNCRHALVFLVYEAADQQFLDVYFLDDIEHL